MNLINQSQQSDLKRINFKTKAQLFSGMDCWQTDIIHLTLQVVSLTIPPNQAIEVGNIFRLNIPIEGARGIAMSIQVTQTHDHCFEAKWNQIDMESFAILKRTIELNSNKQNAVREEIKKFANHE